MPQTALWFMRHGEVQNGMVGAFVGRKDVALCDVGHKQAQGIATFLEQAHVDAVVSSPRIRALDTAKPLAETKGLGIDVRDPLAEMDFGDWEGRFWEDIEAEDPEFAHKWQHDPGAIPCPGGETANSFAARVQEDLEKVRQEYSGQTVAVFAHAGTNRAILSQITGRPYMESFAFAQDYGNVSAAAWDENTGFGQVAIWNHVPGPRSVEHGDGGRSVE